MFSVYARCQSSEIPKNILFKITSHTESSKGVGSSVCIIEVSFNVHGEDLGCQGPPL